MGLGSKLGWGLERVWQFANQQTAQNKNFPDVSCIGYKSCACKARVIDKNSKVLDLKPAVLQGFTDFHEFTLY